jgi:hypothetical protein
VFPCSCRPYKHNQAEYVSVEQVQPLVIWFYFSIIIGWIEFVFDWLGEEGDKK